MKTFIVTISAVSGLAVAATAAAQYPSRYDQRDRYSEEGYHDDISTGSDLLNRIAQLQTRLQAGVQSGAISRGEAIPLRQQLRQLMQLERQYGMNGFTGRERIDLQQRMRTLRQQIRVADGGHQARWDSYDREDGYDRNGEYRYDDRRGSNAQYGRGDRMDRNDDIYDDRDSDRDGRWADDRGDSDYQQGPRTGLGGVVDSMLGVGGLRVGQRASGDLYAVPSQYRGQYRDGNGVYYRSDGSQIYQIDARSNVVVRVYSMNR